MPRAQLSASHQDMFEIASDRTPMPRTPTSRVRVAGRYLRTTPVFDAYWRFANERQNVFFRRISGQCRAPFTSDRIIEAHKFTNTYRASDRVSQYLIRNVIYRNDLPSSDEEIFFRVILFKLFNKIETWTALEQRFGKITLSGFDFAAYDAVLSEKLAAGESIYSAAYIMPSCGNVFGHRYKHQNHLRLLEHMISERFPNRIREAQSMSDTFELMLSVPSIGPFLAYQYVTDLNYSELTDFSETSFVVAGPGALDGIQKCFVDLEGFTSSDVIRFMHDEQERFFANLSLDFQTLWGRRLQLIDCQNIFCEISKYARVAFPEIAGVSSRSRIKQKFAGGAPLLQPWYPPKWGINAQIPQRDHPSESTGSEIARAVQPTMF